MNHFHHFKPPIFHRVRAINSLIAPGLSSRPMNDTPN
jgi:hypothetical protein